MSYSIPIRSGYEAIFSTICRDEKIPCTIEKSPNGDFSTATVNPEGPLELFSLGSLFGRELEKVTWRWRTDNPPKDGSDFVALGRVVWTNGHYGASRPFCAELRFKNGLWLHSVSGLVISDDLEDVVHIDHWMPLPTESGVAK